MSETFQVDFQPLGRRSLIRPGQTLLQAAQDAGIGLASACGGAGTCAECRLRLVSGRLTPPTLIEQSILGADELAAGWRLACQAEALGDVRLDIPPESLTTPQRLQLEGQGMEVRPEPAVREPNALGLAVDIGTTKLAAYLVALQNGKRIAQAGAMNPQIAYGEDVVSRIAYAGREPQGAKRLQTILMETLNNLVADMCSEAGVDSMAVMDAVLVGNTAMHHLASGLPVEQLGRAPFSPATAKPLRLPSSALGLRISPQANVYLPPVIAGYVGADHLAMLLAIGAAEKNFAAGKSLLALDIGTNTEISLITGEQIVCCSCASGPAFEGAHIHEGMRAAPGAIERVRWSNGKIVWQSIEDQPPIGICGSGILDVVAALLEGGLLKPNGALKNSLREYSLVPADQTGLGRDLVVTNRDIHEIQLAKAAIRAGIESLLRKVGLSYTNLDAFIVAGAFGTYLDLRSAIRVGMFPPLPLARFRQVGNAAGIGAQQMLISVKKRRQAEQLAQRLTYLELATNKDFMDLFIKELSFQ